MKRKVTILILSMMPLVAMARTDVPRVTFGAEWSYLATLFSSYHYNYFSQEGYRFNVSGRDFGLYNNGELLLHIGYNINEYWNLSAYAGMNGLADYHNAVPVNMRLTRYFGHDPLQDRWFSFVDAGTGLTMKLPMQAIISARLGGGYRISLSRSTKLDLVAAVRNTYTHHQVYHDNEMISMKSTNRNDAYLLSLSFGISLTF